MASCRGDGITGLHAYLPPGSAGLKILLGRKGLLEDSDTGIRVVPGYTTEQEPRCSIIGVIVAVF